VKLVTVLVSDEVEGTERIGVSCGREGVKKVESKRKQDEEETPTKTTQVL
jgi:hypothetical protein